jgi:septal ring factor EnvC (AmiA/AmiB activator)
VSENQKKTPAPDHLDVFIAQTDLRLGSLEQNQTRMAEELDKRFTEWIREIRDLQREVRGNKENLIRSENLPRRLDALENKIESVKKSVKEAQDHSNNIKIEQIKEMHVLDKGVEKDRTRSNIIFGILIALGGAVIGKGLDFLFKKI